MQNASVGFGNGVIKGLYIACNITIYYQAIDSMKLTKFQLADISKQIDPFAITNFVISDKASNVPLISPDYPFVLDGVAFAICIQGHGRIKVNFREYELEPNTIITILPLFVSELIDRSDDLMMEFLIFSPDFLTDMPSDSRFDVSKHFLLTSCIKISREETDRLLDFHAFIAKQYKRKDHPYRIEMAKGLLYSLLSEIGGIYYDQFGNKEDTDNTPSSRQEDQVYKFFRLLLTHHKEEKSLEFYADKMCLTPKYLSTVIKERTGRTAFVWINEVLIASTKYMLKTTDMTILQLSEELNFPNPSFFGRFFKKHTGFTPVQYREGM